MQGIERERRRERERRGGKREGEEREREGEKREKKRERGRETVCMYMYVCTLVPNYVKGRKKELSLKIQSIGFGWSSLLL